MLTDVLLEAACHYAQEKEAELDAYSENWNEQMSELHEQLSLVTQQRDEAIEKLARIQEQFAMNQNAKKIGR